MGRTWQISGRICLPCGKNLSTGHIAKCDPKFSSWKKLCVRVDVSYFLCCTRKRDRFPRATKEIGDVCTQARKNFEKSKKHQRRCIAWVGQADFGKPELNNRNHGGKCQHLSAKRDQFETIVEIF